MKDLLKVLGIVALIVLVVVLFFFQSSEVSKFVVASGYTDPTIWMVETDDPYLYGCGFGDSAAYLVRATDQNGQRADLAVCQKLFSDQLTLHRR